MASMLMPPDDPAGPAGATGMLPFSGVVASLTSVKCSKLYNRDRLTFELGEEVT